MSLPHYDPNFAIAVSSADRSQNENEPVHDEDASESAAVVAAKLISYARLSLKLDNERTEYSARYLVDNIACSYSLTVKGCLEFAIKNGIPKAED